MAKDKDLSGECAVCTRRIDDYVKADHVGLYMSCEDRRGAPLSHGTNFSGRVCRKCAEKFEGMLEWIRDEKR